MNLAFGVTNTLMLNEEVTYEDGLVIRLTSFSHKRPYKGGPTKATACLSVSRNNRSAEILLSVHGIEGKSEATDGLSDDERYGGMQKWDQYEFRLKRFCTGKSIDVVVTKHTERSP